ncbi:ABC transporter substrate-binding protein [Frigidibacter sp. ROC022]|uniref:ABC transporter substrate-binding protein n=1 Tax=Frigidibacter sp. ROC022 TaxID=2971796 RepID=UPI00215AF0E2|nr:ABC transporter substrate-binding protein [Frigidibacter sp. ROC022]MCR8726374.1 ABC transporter substrate-binding protein [Frigidibacter sp. ROC022]
MEKFGIERGGSKGLASSRRGFLQGAAAMGLASVLPLRAAAQDGMPSGAVIFGNAEPPTANYWDPAAGFGLVDEQVASLVHDSLLSFDQEGNIGPGLAVSHEVKSDKVVALTLREGVTFHDGSPLTAEDVKASIDRLGAGGLAQAMVVTPGITVEIKSPTEIEVVSPDAFGVILSALAYIKILPKANIDNPDNFGKGGLGTGPYKFVSYDGTSVILEANADYWGGAPGIKTVTFRYIEDAQARINALLSGQVDILTRVSAEDLSRVKDNDEFYINSQTPPAQIVAIYQHNGPLGDLKLRQAIAHAINREGIAASIMQGANAVGFSSLPTTSSLYEPLEPKFEYDLDKARALMAESAYPDGATLRMSTSTLVPNQIEIDQIIAASLESIGIKVEVERLEVGAFRTSYNTYDINLNTLAIFDYDPDFVLGFYVGGTAEAVFHYHDPVYEELYAAQRAATAETRQAAVTAAARHLWENQVTLYLSDETWHFIVNKRVQGYVRAPLIGENLLGQATVA